MRQSCPPGGELYTLPNLVLRWGLPAQSELVWLPPGFQQQAVPGTPVATGAGLGLLF